MMALDDGESIEPPVLQGFPLPLAYKGRRRPAIGGRVAPERLGVVITSIFPNMKFL